MSDKQKLFLLLGRIADAVTSTFGAHSEVAVHDMENPNHSLVHISGNVTGRSPGAPITNIGLKLMALRDKGEDVHAYQTKFKDKCVVSSTVCIKDDDNSIIGFFCVNFDITGLMQARENISGYGLQHCDLFGSSGGSLADLTVKPAESVINDVLREMKKENGRMTTEERLDFVRRLDERKFFSIRGAVMEAASSLKVSRYSIYNYLKKIRELADEKPCGQNTGS
jgi:predicted transcriptional regulator YheO